MVTGVYVVLDVDLPLGQLVAQKPALLGVLERFHIDHALLQEESLVELCRQRGLDVHVLIEALDDAEKGRPPPVLNAQHLETPVLLDLLVVRDHPIQRSAMDFLVPLAARVAARLPELEKLAAEVEGLAKMMRPHLDHEERDLFPALRSGSTDARMLRDELRAMGHEHREGTLYLGKVRDAARGFGYDEKTGADHRTLLVGLADLESEIMRHMYLEDRVVAPRVVLLARAAVGK